MQDYLKKLYVKGEFQELVEEVKELEKSGEFSNLSENDQIECYYHQVRSLHYLGSYKDSYDLLNSVRKKFPSPKEKNLQLALLTAQLSLIPRTKQLEDAVEIIKEGDSIVTELSLEEDITDMYWSGIFEKDKGNIYYWKGDLESAITSYQRSFSLLKQTKQLYESAEPLLNISSVYGLKGQLKKALTNQKQALKIYEELENKKYIGITLNNIGFVNFLKGDLEAASKCYRRSLKIQEEIGNSYDIAITVKNIAHIYQIENSFDQALAHYQRALMLFQEENQEIEMSSSLFHIIELFISLQDQNQAQLYFDQLKLLNEKMENKWIAIHYQLAEMTILKDKKLFERTLSLIDQIIDDHADNFNVYLTARITQCQILFEKYVNTGDKALVNELNKYLDNSFDLAIQHKHHRPAVEISLLQGKIVLLLLQFGEAKTILQKVKVEAINRDFDFLAMQAEEELEKVEKYDSLGDLIGSQESNNKRFQEEQVASILDYFEFLRKMHV